MPLFPPALGFPPCEFPAPFPLPGAACALVAMIPPKPNKPKMIRVTKPNCIANSNLRIYPPIIM